MACHSKAQIVLVTLEIFTHIGPCAKSIKSHVESTRPVKFFYSANNKCPSTSDYILLNNDQSNQGSFDVLLDGSLSTQAICKPPKETDPHNLMLYLQVHSERRPR